jgi:pseudomonalisin
MTRHLDRLTARAVLGALRRCFPVLLVAWAMMGHAAPPQRVIDDSERVALPGNVHPLARPEFDAGRTDGSLPEERMIMALAMPPKKKAALERLLVEQQDPGSPNFHHWLTPEEFGVRFGATVDEIAIVTGWLQSHGFAIDEVAKGGTWINFTGTVADVEAAFHTEIHDYVVGGNIHHANAADPSIPRALADLVVGVVSLHDFRSKPPSHVARPDTNISNGAHWLSPGDFATIYNVNPLYSAGIDGTGQSVAVVGRSNIKLLDVQNFRSHFGLPANDPQFIINGTDPGIVSDDEESEADLDVEWAGAVAKSATIKFVISKSTSATSGDGLSAQYIVNNNVAPIMTMSFSLCESAMGSSNNALANSLGAQAASQGITSFVSSGDSGAAGCDSDTANTATGGQAVSGFCSTPYGVCVGGTEFMDTPTSTYWSPTNDPTTRASALSYIPEAAWNESGNVSGGSALWSTGGGASIVYPKPSWQVAPGVPSDGARDTPDVSLAAAAHNGYAVFRESASPSSNYYGNSGTSAATPSFASLLALVVQKMGQRQGNANPRLYQLGNAQYSGAGPAVFHDVTVGNNSVPGQNGFSCGTGYDLATGLGSVDATALVNNWSGSSGSTVTILQDSFEGSFPGNWQAYSNSGTAAFWGTSTYRYYDGSHSVYCAGAGSQQAPTGGPYPANMNAWMKFGPFSLADATAASASFAYWLQTESQHDYFKWMVSIDGQNFHGYQVSGNNSAWQTTTLDFADTNLGITVIGQPQVWFAFIFTSDATNQYEGAYVDALTIRKTVATQTCTYSLNPTSQSFAAAAGSGSVSVTAGISCSWTATSNASSWLHVTSGASGMGNGTVGYSVDANSGSARSGTLTIAGQTFTVTQAALACSYSLTPQSASLPASGGTGSFTVTSPTGCTWTAVSNAGWLQVTAGSSGSGTGTVTYSADPNSGSARSGTLTIAGQTFTVTQAAQACSYSLAPQSVSLPAAGGTGSFTVTSPAGCTWTAAPQVLWISVTSGSSGSGNGTVSYSVQANSGSARTGTITAGGQSFTVTQAAVACSYSLSPTQASVAAAGGSGSFTVTAGSGCTWTATASQTWLHVTSGSPGSGNGTVGYTVDANTGGVRSGTVTVAGVPFTVSQNAQACSYSLNVSTIAFGLAGGGGSFLVTTNTGCAWTATATASWIHLLGSTGTGSSWMYFNVDANAGVAREATITVQDQALLVTQAGSVLYSFWLPAVIHKDVASRNAWWRSDVAVLNRSSQTANLTLKMYAPSGVMTMTVPVAGKAQVLLRDVAGQLGVTADSGTLEVLSDQSIFLTGRTYNQVDATHTYGQDYDGCESSTMLAAGQSAWLPQLTQNALFRTNIGVTNTGSTSANVALVLFDGQGNQLWSTPLDLASSQFYQFDQPYLNTPAGGIDNGYAVVTVNSGSGIVAYASVIDQATGDPTTINMKR